ncbi:hypothetical protein [Nocardia brasiliensis]|uniref:hypothetical protein n=1 Tax=Nocardia brasiliensis TaxID=37326 RepID=UPI002453F24A|nr:hypothetical protein [Nocardia brasiliensis]
MRNHFATADEREISTTQSRIAFADNLLRAATRPERIAELITQIIGDQIDTGPIPVGPGGFISAVASGRAEQVRIAPSETDCCQMSILVPVIFRIEAGVGGVAARFLAATCVRTRITLVPHAPCALLVHHQPISRQDVVTKVRAQNFLARLATPFAHLNSIVTDQVVAYVNALMSSPRMLELTRIDIAEVIERAWDTGLVTNRAPST